MLNKLLFIFISLLLLSCEDEHSPREYSNIFSGVGRNSSFEYVENFQSQSFSQKILDSNSGATSTPLLLNNQQLIFSTDDGKIVSSLNNTRNWDFSLDAGSIIGAGFSSDSKNNIYTIDANGKYYTLDSTGKLRFSDKLFEPTKFEIFNTPLTVQNRTVFSSSEGNLVIIDDSGNEIFRNKYNAGILDFVSAISTDKILITLSNNKFGVTDTLLCINSDGDEVWRFNEKDFRFTKGAISNGTHIALAGSIQAGDTPLSKIFYLDTEGKLLWFKEISTVPRFLSMSISGELYLVSYSSGMGQMKSGVFCYNDKGDMNWSIYYDYSIPMPVYIAENEIFFLASNRETYGLFYLNRTDGKLTRSLDVGDVHPIIFYPEVDNDGTIVFAGKESLRLIRIDETAINKMLPY